MSIAALNLEVTNRRNVLNGIAAASVMAALPTLTLVPDAEQTWIATAFAHLVRIYENRELGRPGDSAFCIFQAGDCYVQALAEKANAAMRFEAVSAISVATLAPVLSGKSTLLHRLGFEEPGQSPNYAQRITVTGAGDLWTMAATAFVVMRNVFGVSDWNATTWKLKLPLAQQSEKFSLQVCQDAVPH